MTLFSSALYTSARIRLRSRLGAQPPGDRPIPTIAKEDASAPARNPPAAHVLRKRVHRLATASQHATLHFFRVEAVPRRPCIERKPKENQRAICRQLPRCIGHRNHLALCGARALRLRPPPGRAPPGRRLHDPTWLAPRPKGPRFAPHLLIKRFVSAWRLCRCPLRRWRI